MFDCIVKGGTLADGLGNKPETGDVAIKDGRIAEVGGRINGLAKRVIDADGAPSVVEFNCRFGDPEAQPVMMRLQSDLPALCLAAIDGALDQQSAEWDSRCAVGVVLAAGGYPEAYDKGAVILGLDSDRDESRKIFHAGTKLDGDEVVTNGGRVLCATALGNSVSEAQSSAYELVKQINWDKVYYRTDIGYRAIAREQS